MPQNSYNKAVIAQTPVSVGNAEVHFDPKQFSDFIYGHGYECFLERRLYCPCMNYNDGLPLPNCLNCGGTGKFYINKQSSVIACVGMSNRNKYESWSITNLGIVNITTRPSDKLGFEDRVTLTELEMFFSEILQLRKSDDGSTIFAFTKYFPIRIFEAFRFVAPSQPLVYIDPSLMQIQDNKIIFDFTTFNPFFPCGISLRYTANPQYLVIDINRDMVKTVVGKCDTPASVINKNNLPLNYVGRLLHLLPDAPNLAGVGLFDNTNYNAVPPNYDVNNLQNNLTTESGVIITDEGGQNNIIV